MSQDLTLPELVATMDYDMERGRWPTYKNGYSISMKTISDAFRSPDFMNLSPEDRETFTFRHAQAGSWGGWGRGREGLRFSNEMQNICHYTRQLDTAIAATAKTNDEGRKKWPLQMPSGMEQQLTAKQIGRAIVNSQEYRRLPENEQKKAQNYANRLREAADAQYKRDRMVNPPGRLRRGVRQLRYGERGAESRDRQKWEETEARKRNQSGR